MDASDLSVDHHSGADRHGNNELREHVENGELQSRLPINVGKLKLYFGKMLGGFGYLHYLCNVIQNLAL